MTVVLGPDDAVVSSGLANCTEHAGLHLLRHRVPAQAPNRAYTGLGHDSNGGETYRESKPVIWVLLLKAFTNCVLAHEGFSSFGSQGSYH